MMNTRERTQSEQERTDTKQETAVNTMHLSDVEGAREQLRERLHQEQDLLSFEADDDYEFAQDFSLNLDES